MFTRTYAATLIGIDALIVEAEANITPGLGMFLVGLPDNAVRESQERIRSAFDNSGLHMPGKKVVVNLAPADIRKEGSALDLTIATAILRSTARFVPSGAPCPLPSAPAKRVFGASSCPGRMRRRPPWWRDWR